MWANGLRKALGPDQYDEVFQVQAENRIKWIKEARPGYTLRDDAMLNANNWAPATFLGPQTAQTPDELGVPSYEGTPEENSRMIRAFLRLHGASQVGFVQLEPDTTEKLIYSYDFGSIAGAARFEQGPNTTSCPASREYIVTTDVTVSSII